MEVLFKTQLHRLDVPDVPRGQTVPICWEVPKYRDASQNLGTVALSCSKPLWLFYLFCQRFLKLIKHDKFLFKEIFLLMINEQDLRNNQSGLIHPNCGHDMSQTEILSI